MMDKHQAKQVLFFAAQHYPESWLYQHIDELAEIYVKLGHDSMLERAEALERENLAPTMRDLPDQRDRPAL